jgi:hypothetical protein
MHVHSSWTMHCALWRLQVLILSLLSFFFCVWGCIPLYTSMQKSKEEVCDSILVIMMNLYYPHSLFPWRNWREAYQRLRECQSQPDHTSAQGVNFHQSFPINFSITPWAVYFLCCLKIIGTFMSPYTALCDPSVI